MLVSLQNEQVKHVVALQRRKERETAHEFVVEGRRFVEEALQRGANIRRVFLCPRLEQPEWQPQHPIMIKLGQRLTVKVHGKMLRTVLNAIHTKLIVH